MFKNARKNSLVRALQHAAASPDLLNAFLTDLLTPKEYEELMTRWEIVRRLDHGEVQRVIAQSVGVGIATVTRGAKELQNEHGGFRQILDRV